MSHKLFTNNSYEVLRLNEKLQKRGYKTLVVWNRVLVDINNWRCDVMSQPDIHIISLPPETKTEDHK